MKNNITGISIHKNFIILFIAAAGLLFSFPVLAESPLDDILNQDQIVELSLSQNEDVFIIEPTQDIVFKNVHSSVEKKLKANNVYRFELKEISESNTPTYSIQIHALSQKEAAQQVVKAIKSNGFSEVELTYEDELYKVLVGRFTSRPPAEELKEKLEEIGFSGWIATREASGSSNIMRATHRNSGEIIFEGQHFIADPAEIIHQNNWYQGKLEGYYSNAEINFNLLTSIDSLTAARIAHLEKNMNYLFSEKMIEILALFIRTDLVSGWYENDDFTDVLKRFDRPDRRIEMVVESTEGKYITFNDKINTDIRLFDLDLISINSISDWISVGVDSKDILTYYYPEAQIFDVREIISTEIIVDSRIQRGLKYKEFRQETWSGKRAITVIELDLNNQFYQIKPVLAGNTIDEVENLNQIGERYKALAGINGGYFQSSGKPLGLYMEKGTIVTGKVRDLLRTALLIDEAGNLDMGIYAWQGRLFLPDGDSLVITGANRKPADEEAVIINRYYGEVAPQLEPDSVEIVLNNEGTIIGIKRSHLLPPTTIPQEGFVIQARGQKSWPLGSLKSDSTLDYKNEFLPEPDLPGEVHYALGAGPTLIKEGEVAITSDQEFFQPDIVHGRSPRSALGITEDDKLILVTVDGRQPERSIGMTLEELANFMKEQGAVTAMNLDGGASARMLVRGFTMNLPSAERNIGNAILIIPKL
ncbi:MAG: phosphodiester glycosidase family protein [Bacillota bacterium]